MVPFEHTTFYSCHCKYSLYHCGDQATYWSKSAILHSTPALGSLRQNIAMPFGMEKLEEKKQSTLY